MGTQFSEYFLSNRPVPHPFRCPHLQRSDSCTANERSSENANAEEKMMHPERDRMRRSGKFERSESNGVSESIEINLQVPS